MMKDSLLEILWIFFWCFLGILEGHQKYIFDFLGGYMKIIYRLSRILRKILKSIEEYWRILENIEEYWRILKNIEEYWRILKNIEEYWSILKHAERYWGFLEDSREVLGGFLEPLGDIVCFRHTIQHNDSVIGNKRGAAPIETSL